MRRCYLILTEKKTHFLTSQLQVMEVHYRWLKLLGFYKYWGVITTVVWVVVIVYSTSHHKWEGKLQFYQLMVLWLKCSQVWSTTCNTYILHCSSLTNGNDQCLQLTQKRRCKKILKSPKRREVGCQLVFPNPFPFIFVYHLGRVW